MPSIGSQGNYDRQGAVTYAHTWAYGRNPQYYNYNEIGGDCTNFASQCLNAGSHSMNYNGYGWFYHSGSDHSPSWTGVNFLFDFLTGNRGRGPYAKQVGMESIEPGDIIQLAIGHPYFHHSPVVVHVGEHPSLDTILIAAHTYDADYRPISTYGFHKIRFLHILGVRR